MIIFPDTLDISCKGNFPHIFTAKGIDQVIFIKYTNVLC